MAGNLSRLNEKSPPDMMSPLDYQTSSALPQAKSSRALHWLALATACATFPLIFMGGLVTSHHAGMSVPDWPNSYHYNMFLFPPSKWVGGILYEHTHRLMGTVVGFCSILLVVWAWRKQILGVVGRGNQLADEPQRYWALAVLAAVIFQGVLGGLRVVLVKLNLAIAHACVAQAFFCLAAYVALITSRWWNEVAPGALIRRSTFSLALIALAAVYLQLIVGATMRHYDAGLAIPDLPLAYGKLLPPTNDAELAAANHVRAFELSLDPVASTQVWLHFGHRVGALIVASLVLALVGATIRAPGLKAYSIGLLLLLLTQLTLGVITVLLRKPADVASAHVAVGALVLVTTFIVAMRTGRLSSAAISAKLAPFAPEMVRPSVLIGEPRTI